MSVCIISFSSRKDGNCGQIGACTGKNTCIVKYLCYNVGDNRIVRGLLIEEERNIS